MRIFSCNTDINFEAKALKFNKIIELSARTVTGKRVRCDTLVNALNMTVKRTWRLLLVKETPKQQWPPSEAEMTISGHKTSRYTLTTGLLVDTSNTRIVP